MENGRSERNIIHLEPDCCWRELTPGPEHVCAGICVSCDSAKGLGMPVQCLLRGGSKG